MLSLSRKGGNYEKDLANALIESKKQYNVDEQIRSDAKYASSLREQQRMALILKQVEQKLQKSTIRDDESSLEEIRAAKELRFQEEQMRIYSAQLARERERMDAERAVSLFRKSVEKERLDAERAVSLSRKSVEKERLDAERAMLLSRKSFEKERMDAERAVSLSKESFEKERVERMDAERAVSLSRKSFEKERMERLDAELAMSLAVTDNEMCPRKDEQFRNAAKDALGKLYTSDTITQFMKNDMKGLPPPELKPSPNVEVIRTPEDLKTSLLRRIGGREIVANAGGGDCLFLTFAQYLGLNHMDVRRDIVRYISNNWDEYKGFMTQDAIGYRDKRDFVTRMSQQGTWGDHVILTALCERYKVNAIVIIKAGNRYLNDPLLINVNAQRNILIHFIQEAHYELIRGGSLSYTSTLV
jgi:hypothetical protein